MCPEPIGPTQGSPSEKKTKKVSADSDEFKDLMKIDKTKEAELEEKKKRKCQTGEDSAEQFTEASQTTQTPRGPSPYNEYYSSEQEGFSIDEDFDFEFPQTPTQPPSSSDQNQKAEEQKLTPEELEKFRQARLEQKESPLKTKKEISKSPLPVKPKITKEKIEANKAAFAQQDEKKIQMEKEKAAFALKNGKKTEKEKAKTIFEQQDGKKIEKEKAKTPFEETKKKIEQKEEIPQSLIDLPKNIALQTQSLTETLSAYLHPDIVPLFEKMVGTIILIQSKGITETQVLLNSPAFASSVFFGSKITLTQFSTAPNSFNIVLTGSNQAVNLFNENIEELASAFQKGKFDFKIGRIEAAYESEKPLIKRKNLDEEKEEF